MDVDQDFTELRWNSPGLTLYLLRHETVWTYFVIMAAKWFENAQCLSALAPFFPVDLKEENTQKKKLGLGLINLIFWSLVRRFTVIDWKHPAV